MEYLPEGDLKCQHAVNPIASEEVAGVLYQGLLALQYLHSQGIAHRDIKPANILFESRRPFHVKLADFGLAKDSSYICTECGTYLYAAPEIWSRSRYTTAVDIWSLGLVTFEYGFGLPPHGSSTFDPTSWYEILIRAVQDWDADPLIDIVSSSMLRLEPQERRTAAECLQRAGNVYQRDLLGIRDFKATTPTDGASTTSMGIQGLDTSETNTNKPWPFIDTPPSCGSKVRTRLPGHLNDAMSELKPGDGRQTATNIEVTAVRSESIGESLKRRRGDVHCSESDHFEQSSPRGAMQPSGLDGEACGREAINRDRYIEIEHENIRIPIRTSDFRVNVTRRLKAVGKKGDDAKRLRQTGPSFDIVSGYARYRGTYVDFQYALELCYNHGWDSLRLQLEEVPRTQGWPDLIRKNLCAKGLKTGF